MAAGLPTQKVLSELGFRRRRGRGQRLVQRRTEAEVPGRELRRTRRAEHLGPPGEIVERDREGGTERRALRSPIALEGILHERDQHAVTQRVHLGFEADLSEVLHGAHSGGNADTVADEPGGLVAEREAQEHAIDRVLQHGGDAVVVLGRHEEVRVALGDLLVPLLYDGLRVSRVFEVPDGRKRLLKERKLPFAEILLSGMVSISRSIVGSTGRTSD